MTNRIAEMLEEKGWSQRELAQKLGIGEALLNKYVNGHHIPSLPTARAIAEALGITIDELFPGRENKKEESCN